MLRARSVNAGTRVSRMVKTTGRPTQIWAQYKSLGIAGRQMSTSSVRYNNNRNNSPHGDKTPFQVFMDTFKTEWNKSQELQNDIKALQDETGRMAESAAYKRAKEALDKAKSGTTAATSVTGRGLKKAGQVVGDAASQAWDSSLMKHTRSAVSKTAESVDKATEPIRKTDLYKNVKEVIDDGSSIRYGGFEEKEERRRRRQLEEERRKREGFVRVKSNPEAGEHVVLHETAKPEGEKWGQNFANSSLGKRLSDLRIMYEESENGLVSGVRSVTDKIGQFFEETEGAKVIRKFKEMDPNFSTEEFLREFRQYILPEVLDAYVKGDEEILKQWLSEAPLNVCKTIAKEYKSKGQFSAGRVLDIRGVDILQSKIIQPADIPVFIIGCRAQEVQVFKDSKTGEIVAGTEDHIVLTPYAMVVTRIPEEMENEETRGWKFVEFTSTGSRAWT